jgi:hypothetical protein
MRTGWAFPLLKRCKKRESKIRLEFDPRYLAPLATCIGIAVTVFLFLLQRRKELSYQVLWRQPLVEMKGKTRNRIDLKFDGNSARDANFVVVRLTNTGHVNIMPGDYQVRLSIDCGTDADILMAEVAETEPSGLNDDSTTGPIIERIEKQKVVLRPVMLNRHDSVTLQMLVLQPDEKIKLNGHIQGVQRIAEQKGRPVWPLAMVVTGQFIAWITMFFMGPQTFFPFKFTEAVPLIFTFLTGQVLFFCGLHLERQHVASAHVQPWGSAYD